MKPIYPLLWCALLMVLGVKLMMSLFVTHAPLFAMKTEMDVCYLTLFAFTGTAVLFAFLGVFRRAFLWGSIFSGALSILVYLAMAARQDTPEHALPTFITLVLCTATWGFVRQSGPMAFNISEES